MIYQLESNCLNVSVSTSGAEMCKITDKEGNNWLWTGDEPYWKSHASVIFPICGRLNDGKYTYKGKTYEMGCHGFARRSEFTCEPVENGLKFTLKSNEETKKQYPFDFTLTMTYELFGDTIICTESVTNDGKDDLIFAMGGHPGFCVPLEDGLKFEDYTIKVSKTVKEPLRQVVLSPNFLFTDDRAPFEIDENRMYKLHHDMFDNDAIFLDNKANNLALQSSKGKKSVVVRCPQATAWGIWHSPKTEAPFICLEPWIGIPSVDGAEEDLEKKPRMQHLPTGKTFDFVYTISFITK